MTLDFPNSPSIGDEYTGTNGVTYQWDGVVWSVMANDSSDAFITNINTVTLEDVRAAVLEHVLNKPMVIGAMTNPQIAGAIGLTEENLANPDYDFNLPGSAATTAGIEDLGDNLYRIETAFSW